MTIYYVHAGCYSDWAVHGVFSTQRYAEKFIATARAAGEYWSEAAEIGTWVLDARLKDKALTCYNCGMLLADGSVVEQYSRVSFGTPFRGRVEQYGDKVPIYNNRQIVRTVSTVSQEHAVKLAVEARQKWLREQASPAR